MKSAAAVLAALLAFAPAIASADHDHRPRKHKRIIKKRLKRFHKMIKRLDQNGDGVLSESEVGDRFERLRRFDADGDGWVTAREIATFRRRR
jgi:hypothetical protein